MKHKGGREGRTYLRGDRWWDWSSFRCFCLGKRIWRLGPSFGFGLRGFGRRILSFLGSRSRGQLVGRKSLLWWRLIRWKGRFRRKGRGIRRGRGGCQRRRIWFLYNFVCLFLGRCRLWDNHLFRLLCVRIFLLRVRYLRAKGLVTRKNPKLNPDIFPIKYSINQ